MFLNDITYSTSVCDDGVLVSFNNLFNTGVNPNIDPADSYLIEFTQELTIPSHNTIEITPNNYVLTGVANFTPQCFVKIKSEYAEGSQTVLKLTVKDSNYNPLFSQYKKIICSSQNAKPCINPIIQIAEPQYVILSLHNNWEYIYNGYIIAKFSLTDITQNIKIKLPRKDATYLPTRGQNDQIKIVIKQSKLAEYNLTPVSIKTILGGNTAYVVKNGDVIFILDSLKRTIDQIENIQVGTVPSANTTNPTYITLKSLGTVQFNSARACPVPYLSIIKYTPNLGVTEDLGELIFNPDVYQINDEIIVVKDSITITGIIDSPLLLLYGASG